jgi:hypothetical protein
MTSGDGVLRLLAALLAEWRHLLLAGYHDGGFELLWLRTHRVDGFGWNSWGHRDIGQGVAQQPVHSPEAIECVAGVQPAVIIQDDTLARLQGHDEAVRLMAAVNCGPGLGRRR